ncbi:TIGR03757 family integrating conjugative element protein [Vibrio fluvialis]|uniref:TIGR03757 family integrating conjugative element protein n=1 Tax=Vibrio fluvialis TaxID=676 RepID=UPI00192CCF41|nr:TIGR03757 family integrating conjugative element protein [Vibrio fluvialis]MBL4262802.1 TIGR03757 family integrating conjugative element protein [Vibrio fluvialis]
MFKKTTFVTLAILSGFSNAHDIDVFYKGIAPGHEYVPGSTIKYIDVAGVENLESIISQGLSPDPSEAIKQVNSYMSSSQGQEWIANMKDAARGVAKAYKLNLKGVPAIVINDAAVVYGTFDVKQALEVYEEALKE